ncbi:MAG: tripartite tricarboxylate transporter substrate binding protein [Burkholderiaceae bacterium]
MTIENDDLRPCPPDLLRRKLTLGAAAAAAAAGAVLPVDSIAGQAHYPSRPLTFICPWPTGGTADAAMRVLTRLLAQEMKQIVHFKNVAGASGMLGVHAIATARPDGYTIGQIPISITRFALLNQLTHDPRRDFTYLARTSGQTFGIVVNAESEYRTLEQLLSAARARPGRLSYATAGTAGATHIGMEKLMRSAQARMQHVPYKDGAPALADLLGGQVDALADSSSWVDDVKRGRLRLLASWGERRLKAFPDVPTLVESGFNIVIEAPNGIGAPAGIAPHVSRRLREALRSTVLSEEFSSACDRLHAPVMYQDADAYRDYVLAQYEHDERLIEELNLKEKFAQG